MKRRIIVYATSFLDPLQTHPTTEGEGRRILGEIERESDGDLRVEYHCDRHPGKPLAPSEIEGTAVIIADLEHYERELLEAVGKRNGGTLELIARYGVGYETIDVEAATAAGVLVTNTPGANSRPTAEWAVATLLDVAGRRIPHHQRAAEGKPKTGPSRLDVYGKSLGVVGTGAIGRTVVDLLSGFRMQVLATDLYPDENWARKQGARYVTIDEICRSAQFITLHAATANQLIGEREIALMKPETVLINCARGILVNNRAVYRAVADGRLWGYGLDEVWNQPDSPIQGLNIAVSPHVGSDTDDGKAQMQLMAAQSVADWFHGRQPTTALNPEVLFHP